MVCSDGFNRHLALSFEWHLKHLPGNGSTKKKKIWRRLSPTDWKSQKERLRGLPMRIACLRHAMAHPKFTDCVATLVIYAAPDLVDDVWAATCDLDSVCVLSIEEAPFFQHHQVPGKNL